MYFSAAASSEKGQHEFGLKDRPGNFDTAIERRRHPAQYRMPDLALDVRYGLAGIGLVPPPVQRLGGQAELDNEVARKVLRLGFASLFPPKTEEGNFVVAHDDPGVGPADEVAAVPPFRVSRGSGAAHLPLFKRT